MTSVQILLPQSITNTITSTNNGMSCSFTLLAQLPIAPRITSTPGNGSITLTLTPPSIGDTGGSPITSYTITGTGTITNNLLSSGTATISGLTNGTLYTFNITTTNMAGTSSPTQISNTPCTIPNAPIITPITGDGIVILSLTPPTDTGGSPITGYSIATAAAGASIANNLSSSGTAVITGVANGAAASFNVTATNLAGTPSKFSNTPFTIPNAPVITSTAGDGIVILSLTLPSISNSGGTPITSYTVTGPGTIENNLYSSRMATISGLTNDSTYTFNIIATNIIGNSTTTSLSETPTAPIVTPSRYALFEPPPPTILNIDCTVYSRFMNNTFISFSQEPAAAYLKHQYSTDGGITWITALQTSSPIVIQNLVYPNTYSFALRSFYIIIPDWFSIPSNTVYFTYSPIPSATIILNANYSNNYTYISFSQPNSQSPIANYQYSTNGGTIWTKALQKTSPIIIPNLVYPTPYSFVLRSMTNYDEYLSINSNTLNFSYNIPKAPTNLSITNSTTESTTISFYQVNESEPITSYQYSTDGGTTWTTASQTTSPIIIPNLVYPNTYNIILKSKNSNGTSQPSSTLPLSFPGPPSISVFYRNDMQNPYSNQNVLLNVYQAVSGNYPIVGYKISANYDPIRKTGTFYALTYNNVDAGFCNMLNILGLSASNNPRYYDIVIEAITSYGGISPVSNKDTWKFYSPL